MCLTRRSSKYFNQKSRISALPQGSLATTPGQGQSEIKTRPVFHLKVRVFQLAVFFNHCCNVLFGARSLPATFFLLGVQGFIDAAAHIFVTNTDAKIQLFFRVDICEDAQQL